MKNKNNYLLGFVLLVFLGALLVPYIDQQQFASVLANPLTWIIALLVIFLLISIAAVNQALESIKYFVLRKEGRLVEEDEAEAEMLEAKHQESFFARLWRKLQDARPVEKEAEIELDHNYDGIRELDNNLPPWWLWGFYLSIAFAVIYLVRFHVLKTAPLSAEEYQEQMAEAEVQKAEYLKNAANLVDETSVVLLTDEAVINEGAQIFTKNCAVCHGPEAGGNVGPNLTDAYWLHGGDIKDVFTTIKYGVPAKGMISWKDQLNPAEIQKVASYILSLQGSNPANPKPPQGDLYQPAAAPADSTNAQPADTVKASEGEAGLSSL